MKRSRCFRAAYAPGGQDDRRLFDALLIAALTSGEKEEAVGLARGALAEGSLRLVPRAVLAFLGEKSMEAFAREARNYLGEDDFTILEAALAFDELGRRDAARCILEVSASTNPLTYYYLAYWGGNTDALATAARLEHDRVFPSRPETIPVLQFVIERTGDERAPSHARQSLTRGSAAWRKLFWRGRAPRARAWRIAASR